MGCRWQSLSGAKLAPYATRNNTEINGPGVSLKPEAGQALGMVLHKLATSTSEVRCGGYLEPVACRSAGTGT